MMSKQVLQHLCKRKLYGDLILVIADPMVPAWFVKVLDELVKISGGRQIKVLWENDEPKRRSRLSRLVFTVISFVEKVFLRQSLNAFAPICLKKYYADSSVLKLVALDERIGDAADRNKTDVCIDFSGKTNEQGNRYNYSGNLLGVGVAGVAEFIYFFLCEKCSLSVSFNHTIVWHHYFQTMAYGIDKNIGFLSGALKQSVECIWQSEKDTRFDSADDRIARYLTLNRLKLIWNWMIWRGSRIPRELKKFIFIKKWIVVLQQKDGSLRKLSPKDGGGWADPFIVDDKYLFVEKIHPKTEKGSLEVLLLDNEGEIQRAEHVVEEPFHLSYPNVIRYDDRWLIIPESAAGKGLRLYESKRFPFDWNFVCELRSNVSFFDFTPLFFNEKWWLFTVVRSMAGAGSFDQLYLFYADDLLKKDWHPHRQNPIVTDSASARPAGNLFWKDGELFRPSQDCFMQYGGRVSLNKVLVLNETRYKEEHVEFVSPASLKINAIGVHTYSKGENTMVYDARVWCRKF